jgi:hypothetical protein
MPRESRRLHPVLTCQSDFSDLENWWLRLAASYEFSERLASRLNDRGHTREILRRYSIVPELFDTFTMLMQSAFTTVAYNEIMKAVS